MIKKTETSDLRLNCVNVEDRYNLRICMYFYRICITGTIDKSGHQFLIKKKVGYRIYLKVTKIDIKAKYCL